MSNLLALGSKPSDSSAPSQLSRSPERQALAAAIAVHAQLSVEIEAIEDAHEGATQTVYAARHAVEGAEKAIEEAKTNAADFLTNTLLGTGGTAPLTIKQARAALQDAEDELAAALAAREALRKKLEAVKARPGFAENKIKECALAVIATEAPIAEIVARREKAYREFVDAENVLQWFQVKDLADSPTVHQPWEPKPTLEILGAGPWDAVLEALQTDADAPLPVVGS
jgi:chromosome segregation ATPase